ncbi:MAG: flagellar hook-length control protein FliK [Bacteroidetes bacterium]|nr:flagellar hook-length control protein FliK [Bacteroidota bacterium]MCL5026447.1 flagellar hook-length control protein FliK [Chloroflexota bacterium]
MEIAGIFNQTSRGEPAAPALQATAAGPQGSAAGSLRASVAEQIARRAHLAVGQGRAGLSIQLEPKDLGKVQVHVSIGADGLRVGLAAEASDTREIIQASLPLLRAAFESQGLVVERFDLGIGAGFAGWGSPGGSAQQRQGLGSGQPNGYYPANEETGVDGGEVYETGPRDTLVDYRI